MTVINAKVGSGKYPVLVSDNSINELIDFCDGYSQENVVCIVDEFFKENDNSLYNELNIFLAKYKCLYLPGGLQSKGLEAYSLAMKWLLDIKLPRDGVIVAIGGGVIGDLSAFVASTYMRGTGLVLVPTTTTSMIDSAIGGKTGINFQDQVNAIGTYYNPKAVFMDVRFLLTLNTRDYFAGICEAIKMSVTSDAAQAKKLLNNSTLLASNNREIASLVDLVIWSTKIKLFHVGDDPNEKGIRLTLNYGHTFGQSIETFYGLYQDHYRHGEAVALGMICAASAINSINQSSLSSDLLDFTKKILKQYNLPVLISDQPDCLFPSVEVLVNNLINDKKRTSQGNRFVLVPSIGTSIIQYIDNKKVIASSFQSIMP
ncbi:3-dehydroquinate synthase family protein [Synechococcus sp. KORDI-52]|uniref:3-dehydroquinate synthase n=1 Tax=Synechococcus sp. KORDI-52 TaxID=585425 RepID=UPI0008FFD282|nr:3-dehydroquinate synthase family protein [Synechococcus sp. KORDI-52]